MAKLSDKSQNFVSGEIGKFVKKGPSKGPQKGKPFGQKQAVAAAFNVARKKGFKVPPPPGKSEEMASVFDSLIGESGVSIFDEFPTINESDQAAKRMERGAIALALVESLDELKQKHAG